MIILLILAIIFVIFIFNRTINYIVPENITASIPIEGNGIMYSNTTIYKQEDKNSADIQKIQVVEEKIETDKIESKGKIKTIYRPQNFKQFIGQENSKKIIELALHSSKNRGHPFPHILLYAHAGFGKTTMARIIGNEMGVNFVEKIATSFKTPNDIINAIEETGEGGILFIDEIHSLYPLSLVEFFYPIMEDFQIHGKDIIPFTLIGATTEKGQMINKFKPFVRRFKTQITFEDYTKEELITIIRNYSKNLFSNLEIDIEAFENIASKSRGTPATAIRFLESCRDYCSCNKLNKVNKELTEKILALYQIYENGITKTDIKVLNYLSKSEKAVGLSGICQFLDTSQANYISEIEPFLVKQGYILRTPRGRQIADEGKNILVKVGG